MNEEKKLEGTSKGFGKIETYFFEDERYMIKSKTFKYLSKISKSGNTKNACYVQLYKGEAKSERIYVSNKRKL